MRYPEIATSFSIVRDPTKRPAPVWRCCLGPKELPGFARSKVGSTLGSRPISLSLPKTSSRNPLSFERSYFSLVKSFMGVTDRAVLAPPCERLRLSQSDHCGGFQVARFPG